MYFPLLRATNFSFCQFRLLIVHLIMNSSMDKCTDEIRAPITHLLLQRPHLKCGCIGFYVFNIKAFGDIFVYYNVHM